MNRTLPPPPPKLHQLRRTIGINGWGDTPAADVWYSQVNFSHTLTISGNVSIIAATPLPSTSTMLVAGFFGFGFFSLSWGEEERRYRRSRLIKTP